MMYCVKCGEEIVKVIDNTGDVENTWELSRGEHRQCDSKLRHCNYCGKKESKQNPHAGYGELVFCQPPRDARGQYIGDSCRKMFKDVELIERFAPYKDKLPKFNKYLQDLLVGAIDCDEWGEEFEVDEFINDVNTHDGYIVWYNDSDGRVWYKKVPNNTDVLKYIIKSEHRVSLGMGCNQYVDCVIYNGEELKMQDIV